MRYQVIQRMDYIAELLRERGVINRSDLHNKFGISTPQASHDLKQFMELHPGQMEYDFQKRQYRVTK